MNTFKISNISLSDMRKYLKLKGAKKTRTEGGHEFWYHKDLPRPITLQSHIDPVYEFIVKQIIAYFNDTKEDFHKIINPKLKTKAEEEKKPTKRGKRANKKPGK